MTPEELNLDPDREALRKSHKDMKQKPPPPETNHVTLIEALEDPEYQRGLNWRKGKLTAIQKALIEKHAPQWIMYHLAQGGLTEATANKLMRDAQRKEPPER